MGVLRRFRMFKRVVFLFFEGLMMVMNLFWGMLRFMLCRVWIFGCFVVENVCCMFFICIIG